MEFNINNLVPVPEQPPAYRAREKAITATVLIAHVLMLIGIIGTLTLPFPIGFTIFSIGLVVLASVLFAIILSDSCFQRNCYRPSCQGNNGG